jgi:hypothetical protein
LRRLVFNRHTTLPDSAYTLDEPVSHTVDHLHHQPQPQHDARDNDAHPVGKFAMHEKSADSKEENKKRLAISSLFIGGGSVSTISSTKDDVFPSRLIVREKVSFLSARAAADRAAFLNSHHSPLHNWRRSAMKCILLQ